MLTDISTGAQRMLEFSPLNPMGKGAGSAGWRRQPVARGCGNLRLCRRNATPEAKLAPPLGDSIARKDLYWLFFALGCIEPAIAQIAHQDGAESCGSRPRVGDAQRVFDVLEAGADEGPWILGANSLPPISPSVQD